MPKQAGKRSRKYRSKIEVLRDFLAAAQAGQKKTRIIGAANLNRRTFDRYADFCLERGLIVSRSGGYAATPQAGQALKAIDEVLAMRDRLNLAVDSLARATRLPAVTSSGSAPSRGASELPTWLTRLELVDPGLATGAGLDVGLRADASLSPRLK